MIFSYYSYNIHNNMFLIVSQSDFLITSCIHAFENYVRSIVLYGLVMSIFNRFFDNRLNRLSKNRFFNDFLKFDFDRSIILKSKNRSLTPSSVSHSSCNCDQGTVTLVTVGIFSWFFLLECQSCLLKTFTFVYFAIK